MADRDVEGHLQILLSIWMSPQWSDIWAEAHCRIESFDGMGMAHNAVDADVWDLCQRAGIVLLTGNRNDEGEESLESTIRRLGTAQSLPVLTIADPNRVIRDRRYAEDVAAQLLEYLFDLDQILGAGRLYLP